MTLGILHLFLGCGARSRQGEKDAGDRDDASHRGQRGGRTSPFVVIASAGRRLVVSWTFFFYYWDVHGT